MELLWYSYPLEEEFTNYLMGEELDESFYFIFDCKLSFLYF